MSSFELIDVIDDRNCVIGQISKEELYAKQASHRVVHTMVICDNKVFIPRRGFSVSYLPGYYCSSAGGHTQTGEDSKTAALRELKEEIGLDGPIEHVEDFFFVHEFRIHVSLYVKRFCSHIDNFAFDPIEVLSGAFHTLEEINMLDEKQFHPQLLICLNKIKFLLK